MVDVGDALSFTSQKGSPSHGAYEGRTLECHERGKGGGGTPHPCMKWGAFFSLSLSPSFWPHSPPHKVQVNPILSPMCTAHSPPSQGEQKGFNFRIEPTFSKGKDWEKEGDRKSSPHTPPLLEWPWRPSSSSSPWAWLSLPPKLP